MSTTKLENLQSATISIDEGSPYWSCTLEILDANEFSLFLPDDTFVLSLSGEEYRFYVNSKSLSKGGPADFRGTIVGVGLGADQSFPRREVVTKVWGAVSARTIVEELLGAGRIDAWDFVDWVVPDQRFSINSGSRLDGVRTLVEAAGGVLEGTPGGNFYIREKFPITPWKYKENAPAFVFDEMENVITMQYDYSLVRYVDQVRVTDFSDSSESDSTEFTFDEGSDLQGTVQVYPHPWRESIELVTTQDPTLVSIVKGATNPVFRQETEIIEIVRGEGSVKYPVVSIDSVKWKVVACLTLYSTGYTTKVQTGNVQDYSLVEITYTTKSIDYRVVSSVSDTAQFLVKNIS